MVEVVRSLGRSFDRWPLHDDERVLTVRSYEYLVFVRSETNECQIVGAVDLFDERLGLEQKAVHQADVQSSSRLVKRSPHWVTVAIYDQDSLDAWQRGQSLESLLGLVDCHLLSYNLFGAL